MSVNLPSRSVECLTASYESNSRPSMAQCHDLGLELHPNLTAVQVNSWFLEKHSQGVIKHNHEEELDSTQNSSASSYQTIDLVEELPSDQNIAKNDNTLTSLDTLLAGAHFLTNPNQIRDFIRFMLKCITDAEITRYLNVIALTKTKAVLDRFTASKGMQILDNWLKVFGLSNPSNSLIALKALSALPFIHTTFKPYTFLKFVKKMTKSPSQDCKKLAVTTKECWEQLAIEQFNAPPSTSVKVVLKRPTITTTIQSASKKAKLEKISPKPAIVLGSFDIFNKAPEVEAMKVRRLSAERKVEDSKVQQMPSPVAVLVPKVIQPQISIPKAATKVEKRMLEEISFPSYKKVAIDDGRRSVSFQTPDLLFKVRYFNMDDPPLFITDSNQTRKAEVFIPETTWTLPRSTSFVNNLDIRIPNFEIYKIQSQEIARQEARESSVLSAVYYDVQDIPDSPAEPLFDTRPNQSPKLWPLNPVIPDIPPTLDFGLLATIMQQTRPASNPPPVQFIQPYSQQFQQQPQQQSFGAQFLPPPRIEDEREHQFTPKGRNVAGSTIKRGNAGVPRAGFSRGWRGRAP